MKCANAENKALAEGLLEFVQTNCQQPGSKLRYTIQKAVKSIMRYPLPITTFETCMELEGVGSFLATKIMSIYEKANGITAPLRSISSKSVEAVQHADKTVQKTSSSSSSSSYEPEAGRGPWMILVSSFLADTAYSVLSSSSHEVHHQLSKPIIIHFCKEILTCQPTIQCHPESVFNNALKTLVDNGLMMKSAEKGLFSLTTRGKEVGQELVRKFERKGSRVINNGKTCMDIVQDANMCQLEDVNVGLKKRSYLATNEVEAVPVKDSPIMVIDSDNDDDAITIVDDGMPVPPSSSSSCRITALKNQSDLNHYIQHTICGLPLTSDEDASDDDEDEDALTLVRLNVSFEVVCLVDNRETGAALILAKLQSKALIGQIRQLACGDVVWIVRCRSRNADGNESVDEFLFGFIVERKTRDDLWSSIADGRYDEQKNRLTMIMKERCVARDCPRYCDAIYLVEGNPSMDIGSINVGSSRHGSNLASIESAIASAMVTTSTVNGFSVVKTRNIDHTIDIIVSLHERLVRRLAVTTEERLMSYDYYQSKYSKIVTEQDTSVKFVFQKMMKMVKGLGPNTIEELSNLVPTPSMYGNEPLDEAEEQFVEDVERHLRQSQKHRKVKVPTKALRKLHSVITRQAR